MPEKRGIGSAPLKGRRVLVRVDFNVPLDPAGQVADDRRIVEAMPTLDHLRTAGARSILMSHLGRPNGHRDPALSLRPVVHRLSALLGQPVPLADDPTGVHAIELTTRLQNGQFMMLENLRFWPGEEANDPGFAATLARLGELFVEDAFGTVHRAHASTVGVPKRLPSFAGLLVEREVRELSRLRNATERPYVVIAGGAKVSDKLPLLRSFCGRADAVLLGGALAFPFLADRGASLGATKVEPGLGGAIAELRQAAEAAGTRLVLPTDLVVLPAGSEEPRIVDVAHVPAGAVGYDIGPETRARFEQELEGSRSVLWNGPLGWAEDARFRAGTADVLGALGAVSGYHVAAGGDSARIAQELGVAGSFQFISTGGGAALEFVEGRELPGLAVLPDA